jgi:hypothetical protein
MVDVDHERSGSGSEPPSRLGDGSGPGSWRLVVLWFLMVLAVVYLPLFLGQIIFTRDIAHWIFPARWFVRDSLLAGHLPLWNPYQGLGFPVLGDPLYGVFYPPNWLYLLVGSGWVANATSALDFLHMAWGGFGVLCLARRFRATPVAAGVAALAWSLSGYMTAQWTAGLRLHAGAWIPWVALGHLALLSSLRAGGRRWMTGVVKAALPTGLALLMGEIFLAVMGVGLAVAFVAMVQISERRIDAALPRFRSRWLAAHILAVGIALGVGAVVLLPARAVMVSSARSEALTRENAEASSLHPLRLLEFVAPKCMGDVYGDYPAAHLVGEPRLDGLPLSYSVYLGASVLALALAAFRRRFLVLALGGLTGLALLVAFGKYLPVHAIVRRLVPPLAYMRFPEKYLTLVVVGVALLAGLGAKRVLGAERQPWRRTAVFLGCLVAVGVAAPFLFPYPWSGYMVQGLRHGAVAVLALLGVQVLAARGSRLAAPTLVVTVALDLAVSTIGLQGFVPAVVATNVPATVRLVKADHGTRLEPPRVYRSAATDRALARGGPVSNPTEGELRLLATLIANTVNVWGIATLPGYDAGIPARMDRLWDIGEANRLASLQLLGADYVLLPSDDIPPPIDGRTVLQPLADPIAGTRLFRVVGSLPPVFLAGQAEVLTDDEAARRQFEPAVVSGEVVLLAPEGQPLAGPPGRVGTCVLQAYEAHRVEARCRATRAGLAVFVEQYDPGWNAIVDGRPAPILRANLIMRAVALSPGDHRILLEYQAPGLRAGLAVTVVALGVLLVLAALSSWFFLRRTATTRRAEPGKVH